MQLQASGYKGGKLTERGYVVVLLDVSARALKTAKWRETNVRQLTFREPQH